MKSKTCFVVYFWDKGLHQFWDKLQHKRDLEQTLMLNTITFIGGINPIQPNKHPVP